MHRDPLLKLLSIYRETHPEEEVTIARFERFVREHPTCFDRELLVGHVTGSAWVVDLSGERVLLTHHRKLGRWLQLGGHCDGCADVLAVARKEAHEESGIAEIDPVADTIFDIDIHLIPERKGVPAHFHHDVRFALQAKTETFEVSEESIDLGWVRIDEIDAYTDRESMLRMARKWLARK